MFQDLIEELLKVITVRFLLVTTVGSITTYVLVSDPPKKNEETPEVVESDINEHDSNHSKNARTPASLSKSTHPNNSISYKPTAKITTYDQSNFTPPENSGSSGQNFTPPNAESASSYESLLSNSPLVNLPPPLRQQEIKNKPFPLRKSSEEETFWGSQTRSFANSKKSKNQKHETTPTSGGGSSSSSSPAENTCSTNVVGGTFGNPVGITLSCVYPSDIKYCLSATATCCDPDSAGVPYTTQVVIGPTNGNYCLSFMGDSATGGTSIVYEQNYTINLTLPNLSVGHEKIFYQTTELLGTSYISSTDFGKANFSVGQINLKSHDPGPAELNYTCDDIIANYASVPAPLALEVLSLFDVSLAPPSSQVEIPLRLDQLDYGDNFITSYIENNSYVAPLYSCSTTKVNLDDFEYFQADVAQSVAGDNSVREFEGQFSSYGFFEDDSVVFRGPAGVSSVEATGQNLKSGLFGMFY